MQQNEMTFQESTLQCYEHSKDPFKRDPHVAFCATTPCFSRNSL